jgi:23S rRNA G2069 N7-methylase RlmK/C1962 C5-methylase RlmI
MAKEERSMSIDSVPIQNISQIIQANIEKIKPYLLANAITAYRLINNGPQLPIAVDVYQNNAVIQVFSRIAVEHLVELQTILKNSLPIGDCFFKNRTKEELSMPPCPAKTIIQNEGGHQFKVNLSDYLDTGLFLDHRETRRWLAGLSRDKLILNTFAYSGSFTVYCAAAGAAKTCSVDISRVYCEWIKENLVLNHMSLENNWIYKMDCLEFFQYARKKALDFDIIVIDPPTFSRNKGQSFSVQKDHPALITAALTLLRPGGFILFSTNYREFRIARKELGSCQIKEKTDSVPPDFAGGQPHHCFIIFK